MENISTEYNYKKGIKIKKIYKYIKNNNIHKNIKKKTYK